MNILKLYQDFNIQFNEEGQSHHATEGWVQTNCPFCDDPSDHLGYNLQKGYFNCWRCGWHTKESVIAKLLNISEHEAYSIIKQYGGTGRSTRQPLSTTIQRERGQLEPPLPSGTTALTLRHKTYLKQRGFNPDRLEAEWGLLGTGPVAPLGDLDYRHRIIAPIYWHGKIVSFQARDITGRQDPKYLFCPPELELIPNTNLLYGKQEVWGSLAFGICVEGITDVWRFGPVAFATFGTEVTVTQKFMITQNFRKVAILFDPEEDAHARARKLQADLSFRGIYARVFKSEVDPGAMTQDEADKALNGMIKEMRK